MSDILPTIIIEIGKLNGNVYPLRLLRLDKKLLAAESVEESLLEVLLAEEPLAKELFDRTNWNKDPISLMLGTKISGEFEQIGTNLFSIIHQGKVGEKWDEFITKNSQCRVQLRIEADEIFRFPWELVCNDIDRLAAQSKQTFYRAYKGVSTALPKEAAFLPLRVLIIIGSTKDDTAVLPKEELREIETNIRNNNRKDVNNRLVHRLIDIEKLWNPTIAQVKEKINSFKPHIFHFIGHGEFEGGQAQLVIKSVVSIDEAGEKSYKRESWQSSRINSDFKNLNWLPRLVLINSCRTEMAGEIVSDENQKHIWSIGDVFRKLKIPAIIAMQADISGVGAGIFSGTLYKHLAEFDPIDKAIGHARDALLTYVQDFANREWAIPVLTLGLPPEEILPFSPKVDDKKLREIRECPDLSEVQFFSDRIEKRRELFQNLYSPTNENQTNLVIVKGKEDAGKSWITMFCLEALILLNMDVRYVLVGGDLKIDWLDFLLQIRDGDNSVPNSIIRNPLDEKAFYPFNWGLVHRTNTKETEWDGTPISAKRENLGEKGELTDDFIERTFRSFRQSLVKSAEFNKPLLIVFDDFPKDDFGGFQTQMKFIIENLITQVSNGLTEENEQGEIRSVKFMLVLRDNEFERFGLSKIGRFADVSLNYFNKEEFETCLTEYIRYKKPNITNEQIQKVIEAALILRDTDNIKPESVKEIVG